MSWKASRSRYGRRVLLKHKQCVPQDVVHARAPTLEPDAFEPGERVDSTGGKGIEGDDEIRIGEIHDDGALEVLAR